jgi:hypothetical protein
VPYYPKSNTFASPSEAKFIVGYLPPLKGIKFNFSTLERCVFNKIEKLSPKSIVPPEIA